MIRKIVKEKSQSLTGGFTLIEALVALLVLSVGLLGVAGMQLIALQSSHVSFQRTIASLAAQDAVERLWVELGVYGRRCPNPGSDYFEQIEDGELLNPLVHITEWKADWGVHLPLRNIDLVGYEADGECEYSILVGWEDARFMDEVVSELSYRTRLPGR